MSNIIPELVLYNYLTRITSYLVSNLESSSDDTSTLLYKILGGNTYKNDNYFNAAKELFLRKSNRPDALNLQLYFHLEPTKLPSVSLSVPGESPSKSTDVIGLDGGEDNDRGSASTVETYNRNFEASLNVVIASKNPTEQTILYHVYRGLIISILPILELAGFRNPFISGKEVQVNPELIGSNMYVRIITINFFYEVNIPSTVTKDLYSIINFEGTPKDIINFSGSST